MTTFLFLVIVAAIFFVLRYNRLQGLAHQVQRFNGDIMVSLQKRADLANRLMDIAKEYGNHEKLSHITVSNNFREAMTATSEALTQVNAISQTFPQLRASESYNLLMTELGAIETSVQVARELYNEAVSVYNAFRAQLPQSLFSSAAGFKEAPYFNTENLEAINDFRVDDGEILKKVLANTVDRTAELGKKGMEGLDKAFNKKGGGAPDEPSEEVEE